ncbi:sigma factor [Streptomyces niveus]|uniref:sigma factor n=1 Tax=Streptomyces niveus TaxID=193462 RepID=UPI0036643A8C
MSRVEVTDEQIREAQAGNGDAMWAIVSAFDPMLSNVIKSVAPGANAEDREDLLQEARAVLIQHVRDYDSSSSSAALHTFAYRTVRRAVAEEWVRSSTSLTIDPTAAIRVKRAVWDTDGDIEGAWMIVSSDVNPKRRMSREKFQAVIEAIAGTLSMDQPVSASQGGGHTGKQQDTVLADTIPDASSDFTDAGERRDLARYLLREIPTRQSLALRAFYGIGMTKAPDNEVAADMAVSLAALRKLRSNGISSARAVAHTHGLAA